VTAKTVVRLLPPLTLTRAEVTFFIETLERLITQMEPAWEVN
jgi:acetylornithine/N-succinyldiaminopimelate aminotransferase